MNHCHPAIVNSIASPNIPSPVNPLLAAPETNTADGGLEELVARAVDAIQLEKSSPERDELDVWLVNVDGKSHHCQQVPAMPSLASCTALGSQQVTIQSSGASVV